MKRRLRTFKKREHGQSVIEFVLVAMAFFTVFFMFVKLAINFAVGHYVHFATFMSARAFFAGNRAQSDQIAVGNRTLAAYVGEDGTRFGLRPNEGGSGAVPGSNVGPGPSYNATNSDWHWNQGVTFTFRQRIYLIPLIRVAGARREMELQSESWLGREPTFEECDQYMNTSGDRPWFYDNGC